MSEKLTPTSTLKAPNMEMPVIGLGTWLASTSDIEIAVSAALKAGYRHIDTAYFYSNEEGIGNVLQAAFAAGDLKREDIFIVTKLPPIGNRPEYVEQYLKSSLEQLQLDYVDLYLIHNPVGFQPGKDMFPRGPNGEFLLDYSTDHLAIWQEMEKQVDEGRTKAIGVSNFNLRQLKRIIDNCRIKPANIQVEMHIYLQQNDLFNFCNENGVTICAYAPLGSPAAKAALFAHLGEPNFENEVFWTPLTDPVIEEIAKKYEKQPAHVLLRFMIQRGVAVIPKSVNPERIKQNFDIFDFELSEEDMQAIYALDKGEEGRMFNKGFMGELKEHPEYPF